MKKKFISLTITLSILCILKIEAQEFTLKSNDLQGQFTQKNVFSGFGCKGSNQSPQLHWENPPEGTKSFAITIHDPDAPTGSGWWHWVVFDIPANVLELKADAGNIKANQHPKNGIQSRTDFATYGYGGPCPPEGDKPHQYIITVYALKVEKLGLDKNASAALVGFYLNANTLKKASIIAYYQR